MTAMASASNYQITLNHWASGLYPRRISYALILKGLLPSVSSLFADPSAPNPPAQTATSIPNFTINHITLNETTFQWDSSDPSLPKDPARSIPSLRITERQPDGSARTWWLNESIAILSYLEDAFPATPSLRGTTPLQKALTQDLLTLADAAPTWALMYMRHAARSSPAWSGLADDKRSLEAARDAKRCLINALLKLQKAAREAGGLDSGSGNQGWLMPEGATGPGLPDVVIAAWAAFMLLRYDWNVFELDEGLDGLRAWWVRFQALPWFQEYQRLVDNKPRILVVGIDDIEV